MMGAWCVGVVGVVCVCDGSVMGVLGGSVWECVMGVLGGSVMGMGSEYDGSVVCVSGGSGVCV